MYDEECAAVSDPETAVKRLILAPTNEEVNEVNDILQSHLKSSEKEYLACDTPIGSKTHDPYYMGGLKLWIIVFLIVSSRPPNRSFKQVTTNFYCLIVPLA